MSDEIIKCPRCKKSISWNIPFCSVCGFDIRYGDKTKNKSGICFYCGNYKKFSKEHVFPDWIKKEFGDRFEKTNHSIYRPFFLEDDDLKNSPSLANVKSIKGGPYSRVVNNVCDDCNNGWMSRLQNKAKPIVLRLCMGHFDKVTNDELSTISRWVLMVFFNLECMGRIISSNEHQRKQLMNGGVSDGAIIRIGVLGNGNMSGFSHHRVVRSNLFIQDSVVRIQSSYFCIEQAVFHVLLSIGDNALRTALMSCGLHEIKYPGLKIWPFDFVSMPSSIKTKFEDYVDVQRSFGFID